MELILFIYVLVAIVVTGHILLTREKDIDAVATAADDAVAAVLAADDAAAPADLLPIDCDDIARLIEWAEDGHMPAHAPVATPAATAAAAVIPGEEEDKWEDLAEDWEFPEIGKNNKLPVVMIGNCRYNRALRGCGRRGKGKQKGGKHINKKKLRRADTKAHLSILEDLI